MKIRLALTLTIGRDRKGPPDPVTVDMVGTHHDIQPKTGLAGFRTIEEERGR